LPGLVTDVLPDLVDTHAHLDEERFSPDRNEVVARAAAAGVRRILTIATTAAGSQASQDLAVAFPNVFASAGIHPNYASQTAPDDWDLVVRYSRHPRVRALGETGLDRFHDFTPFPIQEDYFARHLELSRQSSLPVVIHCRDCEPDMLRMLRADFERHGPITGVMHSFAGSAATAAACLEMGLHISFSGMLTYKKSEDLRSVAAKLPIDRLLVETDSPYLAPMPHRGKRNEPAFVVHTAQCLADVLDVELQHLAQVTTRNADRLFKLVSS
jgi:TatD DNase family protein